MPQYAFELSTSLFKQIKKTVSLVILTAFIFTSVKPPAYAQMAADAMPRMPMPGVMLHLSPEFTPAYLKGITIHPENALNFDFIVYRGDKTLSQDQKKQEYNKLIKYFLASLTIPDNDQWVNLSPYEKDRIINDDFGKTKMGRDLLAEDYILKQITASLIYPESKLGRTFWDKVYSQAQQQFGSSNIPVNTFNKVWIVPDNALVYEKGNTCYVISFHLKVMLEEDYLSLKNHSGIQSSGTNQNIHSIASNIVRQIVLPELEKEINEGENFASLRQVFSGVILAAWFKRALKQSLLGQMYANKAKVKGVDQDPRTNQEIYQRYLKAYKKGVFNYIKDDVDKYTNEVIPRKYFSGGMNVGNFAVYSKKASQTQLAEDLVMNSDNEDDAMAAMTSPDESSKASNTAMVIQLTDGSKANFELVADVITFLHGTIPSMVNVKLLKLLTAAYMIRARLIFKQNFDREEVERIIRCSIDIRGRSINSNGFLNSARLLNPINSQDPQFKNIAFNSDYGSMYIKDVGDPLKEMGYKKTGKEIPDDLDSMPYILQEMGYEGTSNAAMSAGKRIAWGVGLATVAYFGGNATMRQLRINGIKNFHEQNVKASMKLGEREMVTHFDHAVPITYDRNVKPAILPAYEADIGNDTATSPGDTIVIKAYDPLHPIKLVEHLMDDDAKVKEGLSFNLFPDPDGKTFHMTVPGNIGNVWGWRIIADKKDQLTQTITDAQGFDHEASTIDVFIHHIHSYSFNDASGKHYIVPNSIVDAFWQGKDTYVIDSNNNLRTKDGDIINSPDSDYPAQDIYGTTYDVPVKNGKHLRVSDIGVVEMLKRREVNVKKLNNTSGHFTNENDSADFVTPYGKVEPSANNAMSSRMLVISAAFLAGALIGVGGDRLLLRQFASPIVKSTATPQLNITRPRISYDTIKDFIGYERLFVAGDITYSPYISGKEAVDQLKKQGVKVGTGFDQLYDRLDGMAMQQLKTEGELTSKDVIKDMDAIIDNPDQQLDETELHSSLEKGGIDFNSVNLNLHIKRDGNGVPLPVSQQDMAQLAQVDGLVPVIVKITPEIASPTYSSLQIH